MYVPVHTVYTVRRWSREERVTLRYTRGIYGRSDIGRDERCPLKRGVVECEQGGDVKTAGVSGPMIRTEEWTSGPMIWTEEWTSGPMIWTEEWTSGPMIWIDEWTSGPINEWTNGPMDR